MSNKKRTDEHWQTTYTTTPKNDDNIKRVRAASVSWITPLSSTGEVLIFCVNFVCENMDAINELMKLKKAENES